MSTLVEQDYILLAASTFNLLLYAWRLEQKISSFT